MRKIIKWNNLIIKAMDRLGFAEKIPGWSWENQINNLGRNLISIYIKRITKNEEKMYNQNEIKSKLSKSTKITKTCWSYITPKLK